MLDKSKQPICRSKIKYDLEAASLRQKDFYYQVSFPHFKSDEFLMYGVERYKKFLYLKKMNPNLFVVPCYLIDIIWHSHQLHPNKYRKDVTRVLGKILPHDDSESDRTPGSVLNSAGELTIRR